MHATRQRLEEAQAAGDISGTLSSAEMADFLLLASRASASPHAAAQAESS